MNTLRDAAQQALEAFEWLERGVWCADIESTTANLRAALAEPQPEPVATVAENATTEQPVSETPPSDYRRGYWDGFEIGKREGHIEAEDALAEPHPGDFGIPQVYCTRAQAYANWWHANRQKAQRPEPQPEPVALTFAGLTVRELRIPAGMTVRIDRDALIVEPQRDPNDPILVEPNHDPSHAPYVALAEPQQAKPYRPPENMVQTAAIAIELEQLKAERDALLEALGDLLTYEPEHCPCGTHECEESQRAWGAAHAAINAARGKT